MSLSRRRLQSDRTLHLHSPHESLSKPNRVVGDQKESRRLKWVTGSEAESSSNSVSGVSAGGEGAHCAVCLGEWLQPITDGRAASAREITITREMTGWQAHPIISRCRQTNRHTVGSICSTHARTIAWKPPSLCSLCDSCPDPVPIVGWDWTRELLVRDCLVQSLQPTFKVRYVSGRVVIGWYLPISPQSLKLGRNLPSASVGPLEMKVKSAWSRYKKWRKHLTFRNPKSFRVSRRNLTT